MDHATLEGWLYLPFSAIGRQAEQWALREQLTFMPKFAGDGEEPIYCYTDERPGFIGVPRAWGLHYFSHVPVIDRTSAGVAMSVPRLPDPNHPRAAPGQADFMDGLYNVLLRDKTFIAQAGTGTGKTVSALATAGKLGCSTIVILHLERLLDQWREQCIAQLGLDESQIGIVQQDRCVYEGKAITLAMGPSLASRPYDPAFYDYFGFKVVDEVHKFGTRVFAPTFPMFSARYSLGLSATVDREDGGDKVFFWHLGGIKVVSHAPVLPMRLHVIDYDCGPRFEFWGTDPQARARCLAQDPRRNDHIAYLIKRFYETGRQALVVSDSIEHLQKLQKMAQRLGVPQDVMGQFTGQRHEITWKRDEKTGKLRKHVKKVKVKKDELDNVRTNSQIIFATYGMMTEGIDIPRLDAGVDATPKGKATQLLGRIRRPQPGKKKPVWVTYRDKRCAISEKLFIARLRDYDATGVQVEYVNAPAHRRAA